MRVTQLHHVQITVPSSAEEACRKFYGEVLGLREIPKPDNLKKNGGAWYQHGGLELHLSIEDGISDNTASRRHICFIVEDLAAAEKHLRQAGVEILPDKQPIEDWIRFYVRDPGGNRVELAQLTGRK